MKKHAQCKLNRTEHRKWLDLKLAVSRMIRGLE